jgi:hypothetical protein
MKLSKIHENDLFWFVKKCESASTCRLLCIISPLPWGHTLRRKLECLCTLYFFNSLCIMNLVISWKFQEDSFSNARVNNFRKYSNELWMTNSHVGNWNMEFPNEKLCQPMAGVCSCFDLTEGNVVLAPRSVNRQPFHRISLLWKRICNSLLNY